MSQGLFENIIFKMYLETIYLIYVSKGFGIKWSTTCWYTIKLKQNKTKQKNTRNNRVPFYFGKNSVLPASFWLLTYIFF